MDSKACIIDKVVSALSNALLNDEDMQVRCAAAEALGKIPNSDSILALIQALDDQSPEVRGRAVRIVAELCNDISKQPVSETVIESLSEAGLVGSLGQKKPVNVFFSYAHKDEALRDSLATHLSILQRQEIIEAWHDRKILPGEEADHLIDINLNSAQIILLLLSSDFLASKHCYDLAIKQAIARHESGQACVIPIVLRPVDWTGTPFSKLHALPKDAKPVTTWANQDEAFLDIAQGIRTAVKSLMI